MDTEIRQTLLKNLHEFEEARGRYISALAAMTANTDCHSARRRELQREAEKALVEKHDAWEPLIALVDKHAADLIEILEAAL